MKLQVKRSAAEVLDKKMMNRISTRSMIVVCVCVLLAVSMVAPAAAQEDEEDDDDGGDTIINIDLDEVVDEIEDLIDRFDNFVGNLDDLLIEVGLTLLVKPFQILVNTISDMLTHVMVTYPDIKQDEVLRLHHLIFQLTLLLAVPVFMWIGFQHMTGRADGLRPTLKLLGLLVAGGLAPWLLWYPLEISRLVSVALRPEQPQIIGTLNVTLTTAVVIWIEAFVLLSMVLVFIVRNFFLMWFTVTAPLIFLLLFFRPTRGQVSEFIGWFTGFLLIAPFDLIAYRLVLAMMNVDSVSSVIGLIYALGGYLVMLALPLVILSSASSMMLPAFMVVRSGAGRVGQRVKPEIRGRASSKIEDWKASYERRGYGERLKNAGQRVKAKTENRFKDDQDQEEENRSVENLEGYWWRDKW